MSIPIMSLQNFIENIDFNLKDIDNPKTRELRRRLPLELTPLEKKFDKGYIDKLLIHEKNSAIIRVIIDMILQKQNLDFLEQKEKDRDKIELEHYLKAREAQDISLRDENQRLLQIAKSDEQQRANLQEQIALQNLITALESQNSILRTMRKEIIHEAAASLANGLNAIEPFSKIPVEEHIRILSPLFDQALEIHDEYDLLIKEFKEKLETHSEPVVSHKEDSRAKYTPMQDGIGSIESERENKVKSLLYDVYLEKFTKNIPYSHEHLTQASNRFYQDTLTLRAKAKPIDEFMTRNELKQSAAIRRLDELKPSMDKLSLWGTRGKGF
jgi:hypothetical protein